MKEIQTVVPDWAKYYSVDEDGLCQAHEKKPRLVMSEWCGGCWVSSGDFCVVGRHDPPGCSGYEYEIYLL